MLWVVKDVKIHHLEKLVIIPTGDMRKKTHKKSKNKGDESANYCFENDPNWGAST